MRRTLKERARKDGRDVSKTALEANDTYANLVTLMTNPGPSTLGSVCGETDYAGEVVESRVRGGPGGIGGTMCWNRRTWNNRCIFGNGTRVGIIKLWCPNGARRGGTAARKRGNRRGGEEAPRLPTEQSQRAAWGGGKVTKVTNCQIRHHCRTKGLCTVLYLYSTSL